MVERINIYTDFIMISNIDSYSRNTKLSKIKMVAMDMLYHIFSTFYLIHKLKIL